MGYNGGDFLPKIVVAAWPLGDRTLKNDNGSSINSYWTSKDFDFGDSIADKTMQRYYLSADYDSSAHLGFSYGVNRGSKTSVTLNLYDTPGIFRGVVKPSSLTYQRGLVHSFKISNNTVGEGFVVRSVGMKPRIETEP